MRNSIEIESRIRIRIWIGLKSWPCMKFVQPGGSLQKGCRLPLDTWLKAGISPFRLETFHVVPVVVPVPVHV